MGSKALGGAWLGVMVFLVGGCGGEPGDGGSARDASAAALDLSVEPVPIVLSPEQQRARDVVTQVRGHGGLRDSGRLKSGRRDPSRPVQLKLEEVQEGGIRLTDMASHAAARITLKQAAVVPPVADGDYLVRLNGAGAGVDVLDRADNDSAETFYAFQTPPASASLDYTITIEHGIAGLRLIDGTLELVDAKGVPRLRMHRPVAWDVAGEEHKVAVSIDGCAYDTDPRVPWKRAVVSPGSTECGVHLVWDLPASAYPIVVDPDWATGATTACSARYWTRATLLPGNTSALISGGANGSQTNCAEIFEDGSFATTGSMSYARAQHTASLITANGVPKVLVTGGDGSAGGTTELYDIAAGTWSAGANLPLSLLNHTATVLSNGHVLVTGGAGSSIWYAYVYSIATTYLPDSDAWSSTASMSHARALHTAIAFKNAAGLERVLVAGGNSINYYDYGSTVSSVEIFDPAAASGYGSWSSAASLNDARAEHGMGMLPDGRIIVAGGVAFPGYTPWLAPGGELYDIGNNTWTRTSDLIDRGSAFGTITLPNGAFALFGGHTYPDATIVGAQVYDPVADAWSYATGSGSPTEREAFAPINVVVDGVDQTLLASGWSKTYGTLSSSQLFKLNQPDDSCTSPTECQDGDCIGPTGYKTCGPRSCSATSDCGTGYACGTAGTCVALLPNGAPTVGSSACASGTVSSTEGVCCNTSCGGECDRCDVPGSVGTCQLVAAGTPCSGHKVCSGASSSCPGSCSTDADCQDGYRCSTGSCVAKSALAASCSSDAECESGFCVSGTCCDSACDAYGSCGTCSTGTCALSGASGCQAGAEPTVDQPNGDAPTVVYDATVGLWSGTSAIQGTQVGSTASVTGLSSSIFDPNRVSVLHGKVLSGTGVPLSGIRIHLLPKDNGDSPTDYGVTFTRVDGSYDFVVNGGVRETLVFEENVSTPNFLMAERDVFATQRRMVAVDDVKMIAKSGSSVAVTLGSGWQHVTGPTVGTGGDARTPVVIFPGTTSATVTPPGGSPSSTSSIHVRVTEYTDTADEAKVPGTLPPTSAFTYASDVTIDEATPLDRVTFSGGDPILYVDDFIGFDTGSAAPIGNYDHNTGLWTGAPSGRVVMLLGVGTTMMDVDVDGDGYADADVNEDGNTDSLDTAERTELAAIYPMAANKPMWRVTLPHLCGWDVNWGIYPPSDAACWDGEIAAANSAAKSNCQKGSIIDCQNQALSEVVPLAGTGYSLVYRSDRQPGHGSTVTVPVTTASLPGSAIGATVELTFGGRKIETHYNATDLLTAPIFKYRWDGKDALGQTVYGAVDAHVRVGWEYAPTYAATDVFGYNAGGAISANPTRTVLTYWGKRQGAMLANWDLPRSALGGWRLDINHVYDPKTQELFLGDGTMMKQEAFGKVIHTTVGGNARDCGATGDAKTIGIDQVISLALTALGRLYFVEQGACGTRLAYVDANGLIYTVSNATLNLPHRVAVGSDGQLYVLNKYLGTSKIYKLSWDHTTATDIAPVTSLNGTDDFAVGDDGSVYFIDPSGTSGGVVRRIMPSGDVEVVLGPGAATTDRASMAWFYAIATGPEGDLFFNSNGQIYVLRKTGLLKRYFGADTGTYADGVYADHFSTAGLNKIVVGPDGIVYASEGFGYSQRIWKVTETDLAHVAAGVTIRQTYFLAHAPDGASGVGSTVNQFLGAFTVSPDGELYYADNDGEYWYTSPGGSTMGPRNKPSIRILTNALPKEDNSVTSGVGYRIASQDGTEVFDFSYRGQHLQTLDARTGQVLRSFDYDTSGRLTTVTEHAVGGGVTQATTISYGTNSIDITGPYGHDTQLTLDPATSSATQILTPGGSAYAYAYDAQGLMTSFVDPRGNTHRFQYDDAGTLLRDDNAAGGSKSLVVDRTVKGTTTTTITSKEGRASSYAINTVAEGEVRTNTDASGLVSVWQRNQGGENHRDNPDGSTVDWTESVDPRWETQSPIVSSYQQSLLVSTGPDVPLTYTRTMERTATCAASACGGAHACDLTHIAILDSQTDTITVNGDVYTTSYDYCGAGSVPTITTTTPESRTRTTTLDQYGRVTSVSVPGIDTIAITYDSHGRLDTVTQGSGGLQRVLTNAYYSSGTGQKGQLYTSSINTSSAMTTTYSSYDADTRPLSITLPGSSRQVDFTYDASGNLVALDPPGTTATSHGFHLDEDDRLAAYTPPTIGGTAMPTQYQYDRDGQVTRLTRPGGDDVYYVYDTGGRISEAHHAQRSLSWAYDTVGRLASIVGSDGETLQYSYTATGSLPLQAKWKGTVGGSSGNTVSWSYDNYFRVNKETAAGLRAEYTYDGDGLIVQVDVKDAGTGTTLTNGTMTLDHDPGSNMNGLLTDVAVGTLTDSRTYNTFGELASFTDSANVEYVLDSSGHERDQLGRITRRAETYPTSRTLDYAYDTAGRLSTVSNGGSTVESYSYDANGNRTGWTNSTGTWTCSTVDAQDRLGTCTDSTNTLTYTYTRNGDRLTRSRTGQPTQTYTYDAFGNLLSVVPSSGSRIDYIIDGQGRRVGKKVGGTLTRQWVWGSQLRPVAELDGSGTVLARFVYATHVNVPDLIIKSGTVYRVLTDHLGSVRAIVDAGTGSVAQAFDYDSYGNLLSSTYSLGNSTRAGLETFGFAGGMYDDDTKLVRFGARDYDAEIGRWLTKDILGFRGGNGNLFAYSHSDPNNSMDPLGLYDVYIVGLNGGKNLSAVPNGLERVVLNAAAEVAAARFGSGSVFVDYNNDGSAVAAAAADPDAKAIYIAGHGADGFITLPGQDALCPAAYTPSCQVGSRNGPPMTAYIAACGAGMQRSNWGDSFGGAVVAPSGSLGPFDAIAMAISFYQFITRM